MQKIRRGKIDKKLRRELWELSNRRCGYCRTKIGLSEVTVDHKIPISRGGPDCRDNMICSCEPCNHLKGNRTAEEFRGLISNIPYDLMQKEPKYRAAIRFGMIREHRKKRIQFQYEVMERKWKN